MYVDFTHCQSNLAALRRGESEVALTLICFEFKCHLFQFRSVL